MSEQSSDEVAQAGATVWVTSAIAPAGKSGHTAVFNSKEAAERHQEAAEQRAEEEDFTLWTDVKSTTVREVPADD